MDHPNVGNMNGFYSRQYSADDLHRLAQVNSHNAMMGLMGPGSLGDGALMGGQTLDEIITQNKELQRRRSYHQSYNLPRSTHEIDSRRASMLEFGHGNNNELEGFQFDPSPMPTSNNIHRGGGIAQRRLESQRNQRRVSGDELSLDTQFQPLGSQYNGLTQSPVYQQSLNPNDTLDLDVTGTYLPQSMAMDIDYSNTRLDTVSSADIIPMNMFTQANFPSTMTASPLQHMSSSIPGPAHDPGGGALLNGAEQDMMDKMPNMNMSDQMQNLQNGLATQTAQLQGNGPVGTIQELPDFSQKSNPAQIEDTDAPIAPIYPSRNSFSTGDTMPNSANTPNIPQYRNAYSSSGFDMLGVLMRVATRPKPQINIGAVDMSCAFVVCDVTQFDLPIVYCSDIFERLTGYTKHEILGRNCRFLQAPDGKVQSGVKRKYVDDQAVLHLKNMINQRQEAQISLINYRKGGQPFMNLLTMIPITYDSDEMKYFVGFQVDLVEQPTSITNKNPGKPFAQQLFRTKN